MSASDIREVPIDKLVFDDGVQCRVKNCDEDTVVRYADLMREHGADLFPPLKVIELPDGRYAVVGGFHRGGALRRLDAQTACVEVIGNGDLEEARWRATFENGDHGLRLTREDIRHMCAVVLRHPKGVDMSDRQIARQVGTTNKTVAVVRRELVAREEIPHLNQRRGADGKLYTISRGVGVVATPDDLEPQLPLDPEPQLPFDPARHADSPQGTNDAPVSPASPDPGTTRPAEAKGADAPPCATCGGEPCACSRVATPDGEPDPDVPPEIDDDAPPWAGGAADTEAEQLLEAVDVAPDGLTEDSQRKAWCTLREHIQPVLDGIDEHRRSFASLVKHPLLDARSAILNDTVAADFARAGRVFAGVDTNAHEALEALDKLRHAVAHMMPHEVCRECDGGRCGHCQQRGFIFAAEASQREPVR